MTETQAADLRWSSRNTAEVSPWPESAELWPDTAAVSVPQRRISLAPPPQHPDHLTHTHTKGIRGTV